MSHSGDGISDALFFRYDNLQYSSIDSKELYDNSVSCVFVDDDSKSRIEVKC